MRYSVRAALGVCLFVAWLTAAEGQSQYNCTSSWAHALSRGQQNFRGFHQRNSAALAIDHPQRKATIDQSE